MCSSTYRGLDPDPVTEPSSIARTVIPGYGETAPYDNRGPLEIPPPTPRAASPVATYIESGETPPFDKRGPLEFSPPISRASSPVAMYIGSEAVLPDTAGEVIGTPRASGALEERLNNFAEAAQVEGSNILENVRRLDEDITGACEKIHRIQIEIGNTSRKGLFLQCHSPHRPCLTNVQIVNARPSVFSSTRKGRLGIAPRCAWRGHVPTYWTISWNS